MKQVLMSQGWTLYHSCYCGGSRKEFYSNVAFPGYNVVIRPTKNIGWVVLYNQTVGNFYGYQLEDKLKELKIWKTQPVTQ